MKCLIIALGMAVLFAAVLLMSWLDSQEHS